jgi:hypothetical protein
MSEKTKTMLLCLLLIVSIGLLWLANTLSNQVSIAG